MAGTAVDRQKAAQTWVRALTLSPLTPEDLDRIAFTLRVPNCPSTFIEHKRCVVHIARKAAESMKEFKGSALPIDMDTVIAGAILADVGKLLEYEKGEGGKTRQSNRGEFLRHPFTGVALAMECGVPDAVELRASCATALVPGWRWRHYPLAFVDYLRHMMKDAGAKASFVRGGSTKYLVEMPQQGSLDTSLMGRHSISVRFVLLPLTRATSRPRRSRHTTIMAKGTSRPWWM